MEYNKILSNVDILTKMYDNGTDSVDYERIRKIADYIDNLEGESRIQFLKNLNSSFIEEMKYLESMIKMEIDRQRKNKIVDESMEDEELTLDNTLCPKRLDS